MEGQIFVVVCLFVCLFVFLFELVFEALVLRLLKLCIYL